MFVHTYIYVSLLTDYLITLTIQMTHIYPTFTTQHICRFQPYTSLSYPPDISTILLFTINGLFNNLDHIDNSYLSHLHYTTLMRILAIHQP